MRPVFLISEYFSSRLYSDDSTPGRCIDPKHDFSPQTQIPSLTLRNQNRTALHRRGRFSGISLNPTFWSTSWSQIFSPSTSVSRYNSPPDCGFRTSRPCCPSDHREEDALPWTVDPTADHNQPEGMKPGSGSRELPATRAGRSVFDRSIHSLPSPLERPRYRISLSTRNPQMVLVGGSVTPFGVVPRFSAFREPQPVRFSRLSMSLSHS